LSIFSSLCFFFFQAEDGIRDSSVTGVQTCALPIFPRRWAGSGARSRRGRRAPAGRDPCRHRTGRQRAASKPGNQTRNFQGYKGRSEERRVGKECRCGWEQNHRKKKKTDKQLREIER